MKRLSHFSASEPTCRLSDPAQLHKLCRRTHPRLSQCYTCKRKHKKGHEYYYFCTTCNLQFHRYCHLLLPQIKHPFHLSHPLTLVSSPWWTNSLFGLSKDDDKDDDNDEDGGDYFGGWYNSCSEDDSDEKVDQVRAYDFQESCKCCQRRLEGRYYHCSICNFFLNATCSKSIPPLTILHQKSHEHTLTFFPRRLPLPCDACGESLQNIKDVVYSCLSCNFMVHSKCICLPLVIKISRHKHRLSYTSSLSGFFDPSCGVCRKSVNINCGQYSCSKRCHYVVHSKCATRKDVWDGKDLEGIPEEPEEYLEPFVRIDEDTIQHFSHQQHHLKLHKNTNTAIFGETKFCEACCLPVPNSKAFFSCTECDFILDETCANLTRKKDHPLHKHSLILHPVSPPDKPFKFSGDFSAKGISECKACEKPNCGFIYQCCEEDCEFQLDVRCASLPDPLIHGCHPQDHPLFFNLTRGDCMSCGFKFCSGYYLECIKCKSFLGLKCATIPPLAHYKHDRHPLTLHYGENGTTSGEYWCEICESRIDAKTWFYTCDLCADTLHVTCLLTTEMCIKPRHVFQINDHTETIFASNEANSRPLCCRCNKRCKAKFTIKTGEGHLCGWACLIRTVIDTQKQKQHLK